MTQGRMTPDAVVRLDAPPGNAPASASGSTLVFFKDRRFFCWDVANETMLAGYPRDIADHWPGLLEAFPGSGLRGALQMPGWGPKIHFFFEGQSRAAVWDLERGALDTPRVEVGELLPSRLTQGDFTPVAAQFAGGEAVIYAFRDRDYTRWTLGDSRPVSEDAGFPRSIEADWKDGLVLAPRAGVYVEWPGRSSAHSNRKIYFFMGDLYLRWDVPSNTRNYRLDIVSGWKGWPTPA